MKTILIILLVVLVICVLGYFLLTTNIHAKRDFDSIEVGDILYVPNIEGDWDYASQVTVLSKSDKKVQVKNEYYEEQTYSFTDFLRFNIMTKERHDLAVNIDE